MTQHPDARILQVTSYISNIFSALLGGSLPHFQVQGPCFAPEGVVQLEKLIVGKHSLDFTKLRPQQAICNLVSNAAIKCFSMIQARFI